MLRKFARALLPTSAIWRLGQIRKVLRAPVPDGDRDWRARQVDYFWYMPMPHLHDRECPMCGFHGQFHAMGYPPRPEAKCPNCQSLERHRLFWLWLQENQNEVHGTVLHFAPEPIVASLLEHSASHYRGVDIDAALAREIMDIEKTGLADDTIDFIFCSHVLEHVDDQLALSELYRVLKPGGLAVFMFPVVEGWDHTYENPAIKSGKARDLHFGQSDHVRYYGADVRMRITDAGFSLTEFTAVEPFVSKYSLTRGGKIFLALKA